MTATAVKTKPTRASSLKGEIYRQCRAWHGYLSAFAFVALIFFAGTGLLLNHPDWFASPLPPEPFEQSIRLDRADINAAVKTSDPAFALSEAVGEKAKLRGAYKTGEMIGGEAVIRLEGATGSTDITVNLETGTVDVAIEKADLVTTISNLHRGKEAGAVWKLLIDVAAIVVLTLSLIGYVLFFSLRFRLRTSLILTGVSLATMIVVFVAFVP